MIKNKYELHSHLVEYHNVWPCHTCAQVFSNESARKKHKKMSDCKGQSFCEFCNTKFILRANEFEHKLKLSKE
jgi:hypothetical protein